MTNPTRWTAATRHPFVQGVRDATLPAAAFDRWLAQDALFAADLLRFQARLLARAPRAAQPVLAHGCVGIVDELAWFTDRARERTVALDVAAGPAALDYAALLERLDGAPADVALAALWAIEAVYLDAWTFAATGTPGRYAPYVAHWTAPDFADYVHGLRAHADPDAEIVDEVLDCEIAFWDAALG